eukprot:CAMPEP_0197191964 /NCGR_PEP_ID=MMETSP1423-20130617/24322_1 /TAXON_ID=476441 /ORGANISM="Pseudo-nitzschia heimii, Strain UNC1101" /LENGTH=284 /DNA_ID=CAMNT_0042644763 /DNA_START=144 /DNA_END=995 /DNA_ORIENTATION=-
MKRSLHFHDAESIIWIENVNDMSDEEIDACYYNSRDYSCFRDRERRLSRNFSNRRFTNGGRKGDLLGVESPLQRFNRRERSRNAIMAVILEQELRQEHTFSMSEEDALGIAFVYQQYTKQSERIARDRALLNASQIDLVTSISPFTTGEPMHEIHIGELGEEENNNARHRDPPWEVPASKKIDKTSNCLVAMIETTTCSHPLLPGQYLDMLHSEEQRKHLQQFYNFGDEGQFELQVRKRYHENIYEEALVRQKIIRAQDPNEFRQSISEAYNGYQPMRRNGENW